MKSDLRNMSVPNSDTVKRLKQIAKEVRTWTEEHSIYGNGMIDCMCAIASYEIFKRCKKLHIPIRFCVSDFHAYIKCGNIIVDVTADQFDNCPKVLVGKLSSLPNITGPFEDSIWGELDSADTPARVRELLKDWPSEQQPVFVKSTKL
jgi:hypothetical protein